jgi:CcdB protein
MLRQFDICGASGAQANCVVVLQHGHLLDQKTCIVAPLLRPDLYLKAGKLHPVIEVNEIAYVAAIELMSSVPRLSLKSPIANVLS